MREKNRAYAEKIVFTLEAIREHRDVRVVCQKSNINLSTLLKWQARYGGLSIDELMELWHLELNNKKIRRNLWRMRLNCLLLRFIANRLKTAVVYKPGDKQSDRRGR